MDELLLYQDADLVAVNKPSGVVVHRGWENAARPLLQQVRDLVGCHVYPVHRLDRAASGVVVFALHRTAARDIASAFQNATARKRYLALVRGVTPEEGHIDHPIPRAPAGPRVPAVTDYRRLFVFERYSLLEVFPRTGRLHQIRRHLKHISHPLIGDTRYGKSEHNRYCCERFGLRRLALHAAELHLPERDLTLTASLPADLLEPLRALGVPHDILSRQPPCE